MEAMGKECRCYYCGAIKELVEVANDHICGECMYELVGVWLDAERKTKKSL